MVNHHLLYAVCVCFCLHFGCGQSFTEGGVPGGVADGEESL